MNSFNHIIWQSNAPKIVGLLLFIAYLFCVCYNATAQLCFILDSYYAGTTEEIASLKKSNKWGCRLW